jgi:hypothetical protein
MNLPFVNSATLDLKRLSMRKHNNGYEYLDTRIQDMI